MSFTASQNPVFQRYFYCWFFSFPSSVFGPCPSGRQHVHALPPSRKGSSALPFKWSSLLPAALMSRRRTYNISLCYNRLDGIIYYYVINTPPRIRRITIFFFFPLVLRFDWSLNPAAECFIIRRRINLTPRSVSYIVISLFSHLYSPRAV